MIVTPSGETQLPCVAGAVVPAGAAEAVVDVDVDVDVALVGLGLGEDVAVEDVAVEDVVGDGDGDGEGDELIDADTTDAVGLGECLPHVLHGLPAVAGDATASVPMRVAMAARPAAPAKVTRRVDRVIAGAAFRVADGTPRSARRR